MAKTSISATVDELLIADIDTITGVKRRSRSQVIEMALEEYREKHLPVDKWITEKEYRERRAEEKKSVDKKGKVSPKKK